MSIFTVIGRRWFEKVNGNTYHSVEVNKDGKLLERVPFIYGYGDQYNQTAAEIIAKHCPRIWKAATKKYGNLPYATSLMMCTKHQVIASVTDVERKKDL